VTSPIKVAQVGMLRNVLSNEEGHEAKSLRNVSAALQGQQ
jgi:hypothetical protein